MMIIVILFMILAILLAKAYNKKWINLLTIFCVLWGTIIVFSKLQLYGMKEVSGKAYAIVYAGCIMFCLGYLTHMLWKRRGFRLVILRTHAKTSTGKLYTFNYHTILIFEFVILAFELMIAMRVVGILNSGNSYAAIHDMAGGYAETTLLNGTLENYIDSWVVMPCTFALIPICVLSFFEKCRYRRLIQTIGILDLVLYILVHGGRIVLLYVVVYIAILYSIYDIKIPDKLKRKLKFTMLVVIGAVIALTFIRKGLSLGDQNAWDGVFSSIYQYFSVSMPLLGHWVKIADQQEILSYGMAVFHGPLQFITTFTEKIGIYFENFNRVSQFIDLTESTFVSGLYSHGVFNAFVSMFYFFYLDFRWFGVIFFGYLYGLFSHVCEYLGRKENLYRTSLYLLIAQGVLKSFGRWEFYLVSYCLAFVYLRLFFKRGKENG